nr:FG-GAP repeat protein [Planctomycetaceae bacterium]
HDGGCCCAGCVYVRDPYVGVASAAADSAQFAPPRPLADTFKLHSLPGADFVIYLDFDGHTTVGTNWNTAYNGGNPIVSPRFSTDANPAFNAGELEYIQRVWQRVAEDFAPFNVDVTTEDPGVERLRKSGPGDTQWGIRSVQTDDQSFLTDDIGFLIGGIAYLGSFQWDSDTPVFTFNGSDSTTLFSEMVAADTHSHEVGHALGLSHDGRNLPPEEYYGGHGSGLTGWAAIMGAGFGQELSQWSQGEYPNASQTQDDLAIITNPLFGGAGWGYSGLSYRADDHGNTTGTSTALAETTTLFGPGFVGAGLIETRTDVDFFYFDWDGGTVTIDVTPFERGPNLDVLATLYNAAGTLLASSNPVSALSATLTRFLNAGRYYIRVDGVGKSASGIDYGYSDYGSLGQYTVSVTTPPFLEDNYENNNVRGLAADPRNNGGRWDGSWLNLLDGAGRALDDDWFVINVRPGRLRVTAELSFIDADGDLDLFLVNSSGIVVAKSESETDNELIDFVVSSSGTYYLLVKPYANEKGNYYNLRWTDTVPISAVNVAVSPNSTAENGTGNITFTFTRSLDIASAITVNFAVSGAALFGEDYTVAGASSFSATSGTVTFAAGSTTATVVIDPTGDNLVELDEDVTLTLLTGTGYELGLNSSASSLIANDDQARITITDAQVFEGNSGTKVMVFTLTLDRAVDTGISINYATTNGTATAGSDYVAASGTRPFVGTAGETRTIIVTINGDLLVEPDETFELVLSGLLAGGRNVVLDRFRATGTIRNDEVAPAGPTNVVASDNRTDYVLVTWTAATGADTYDVYRSTSATFNAASMPLATGVAGTSYADTTATPGVTYHYWVRAVNMFGESSAIGPDSGLVRPTVTQSVASPESMAEDAPGTLVFTFTRNGDTTQALVVNFTVGGTARFTGDAQTDYTVAGVTTFGATAGSVTFAAGSSTATVSINPTSDEFFELDETVVLRIVAGASYALGVKPAALATITNDDAKPSLGLITTPNAGSEPRVKVYDATGQNVRLNFLAYGAGFTRGVHVATGDVNNDGVFDIITAPASGVAPIRVFSGSDGTMLKSFLAFSDDFNADLKPSFAGGFSVAAGDVDSDGYADIIVAAGPGGGPHVRVFSGKTGEILKTFAALANLNFKGGLNIAAGDIDGDGDAELLVTPAGGAGPFVRVFNPLTGTLLNSFWALSNTEFQGGMTVAAGDVNGDGKAEAITGIASQGGPAVRIYNPLTGALVSSFYAFAPEFTGGVNVGISDFNADGKAEILVGARTGLQSVVRFFNGSTGAMIGSAQPYPGFNGGTFVAGEIRQPVAVPGALAGASASAAEAAYSPSSSGSSFSGSQSTSGSSFSALSVPSVTSSTIAVLDDLFADSGELDLLLTA